MLGLWTDHVGTGKGVWAPLLQAYDVPDLKQMGGQLGSTTAATTCHAPVAVFSGYKSSLSLNPESITGRRLRRLLHLLPVPLQQKIHLQTVLRRSLTAGPQTYLKGGETAGVARMTTMLKADRCI